MSRYDVLVKGGTVVDPSQGIHEEMDVAISKGKVVEVRKGLSRTGAKHVVDASGKMVTPGLVDLHVHAYDAVMPLGVDVDSSCLMKGTTTAVDAGSSGYLNFPGLKKHVMRRCKTRVYAFLNIGSVGLATYGTSMQPLQENPSQVDVERTVETVKGNRDTIVGIKWHNSFGPGALLKAKRAAKLADCKLMCENSAEFWMPVSYVLDHLRSGDILTHVFQGGPNTGILGEGGEVRPEVLKAVDRGVVIDVGHGAASFSFRVAEKAMDQGLLPHVISTDLHSGNINGPVFDLPTTLSKFLMLGLSIEDVILRSTHEPAKVIGLANKIGSLKAGALGDVVTFGLKKGSFTFEDSLGEKRIGRQKLILGSVISGGQILRN